MKKTRRLFAIILFGMLMSFGLMRSNASELFALHVIDVGQGQCILVEENDQYMLIDGGGRETSSFVVSYLKQLGIEHLNRVGVSHYEEDHMIQKSA